MGQSAVGCRFTSRQLLVVVVPELELSSSTELSEPEQAAISATATQVPTIALIPVLVSRKRMGLAQAAFVPHDIQRTSPAIVIQRSQVHIAERFTPGGRRDPRFGVSVRSKPRQPTAMTTNRCWILSERPDPNITDATLTLEERPVGEPEDGEVLVRNLYLSLDPTNRGWMGEEPTYLPPIPLGETMRGITVGRVEKSRSPELKEGDMVQGLGGFADYAVAPASAWTKVPAGVDPTMALGVFGHIGLTAYFGLLEIGKPKEGDTVLVSAAAGATGSLVAQIAKLKGCRVVGTAGGPDKCRYLTEELGIDAAIDYKNTKHLTRAVAEACPQGVNVFFDNVGGEVLDAALANLAMHGRVVLCGAISQYNEAAVVGPKNDLALLVRRASMEGFIVLDYTQRAPEAVAALLPWVTEGKLELRLDIVDGLEHASTALRRLFDGTKKGKLLLKIADV